MRYMHPLDASALLLARMEIPRSPAGIHRGAHIQMDRESDDASVHA